MSKDLKKMTINELKEEYISCCFGSMIYNVNTEIRRKELSKEIDFREQQIYNQSEGISGNIR